MLLNKIKEVITNNSNHDSIIELMDEVVFDDLKYGEFLHLSAQLSLIAMKEDADENSEAIKMLYSNFEFEDYIAKTHNINEDYFSHLNCFMIDNYLDIIDDYKIHKLK